MSAVFGTMAAASPNVTLYQPQMNCERLAAETFNRETADDEDRVDFRAHHKMSPGGCQDSVTSARWPAVHP